VESLCHRGRFPEMSMLIQYIISKAYRYVIFNLLFFNNSNIVVYSATKNIYFSINSFLFDSNNIALVIEFLKI